MRKSVINKEKPEEVKDNTKKKSRPLRPAIKREQSPNSQIALRYIYSSDISI
jgi:hypothetical protein